MWHAAGSLNWWHVLPSLQPSCIGCTKVHCHRVSADSGSTVCVRQSCCWRGRDQHQESVCKQFALRVAKHLKMVAP